VFPYNPRAMEEQVKARLIGATVLVVVAVALVPELLSGPRQPKPAVEATEGKRGTRTVTIDLGGAVAAGSRVEQVPAPAETKPRDAATLPTVQAPGSAAERGDAGTEPSSESSIPPGTGAASPSPAAKVAQAPPVVPPPGASVAATSKPKTTVVVPATSSAGTAASGAGWSVQVGAFGSAETARRLVGDLKRDGLTAYVAPLKRSGKTLHRVRVGPTPTRPEADKLAARLKAKGMPASVVAAD
jgi:DedD protein